MTISVLALIGRILLLGYEKILVKQLGQGARGLSGAFLFFSLGALFLTPGLLFVSWPGDYAFLKIVAVAGLIYSLAFWLYVKSLASGEISRVGPLYHANVFFLLVLSVLFLNEPLTLHKVAGLFLLVWGSSALQGSAHLIRGLGDLVRHRESRWMIAGSFLIAAGRTLDGYVVRNVDPFLYAWMLYTVIALYLGLFHIFRGGFGPTRRLFLNRTGPALLSGLVNSSSYILLLLAFRSIEVSVAEPLSLLSMAVSVLLAVVLFKEVIRGRIAGICLMGAGAWLLSM